MEVRLRAAAALPAARGVVILKELESFGRVLACSPPPEEIVGFEEIFCCPLIPFPGSIAFARLKEVVPLQGDVYDIEELKKLWADNFCTVSLGTLVEFADQILSLGKYRITIAPEEPDHKPLPEAHRLAKAFTKTRECFIDAHARA